MTWTWDQSVQDASDAANGIPYNGGGAWNQATCATRWSDRATALAALIRATFPAVTTIGGLRCSPITINGVQEMSIHAVGRALDVMVGSNALGAEIADWAVKNAVAQRIQLIIWDGKVWQANSPASRRLTTYTGSNPHTDHVHIEVTSEGDAQLSTTSQGTSSSGESLLTWAIAGGLAAYLYRMVKRKKM